MGGVKAASSLFPAARRASLRALRFASEALDLRQGIFRFSFVMLTLAGISSASAQSILGKERPDVAMILEGMASVAEGGVRSGSCLRRTGDEGSEDFAVYLLLPASRIEGFVVEISGDAGAPSEIVANAGIVSFDEDGDMSVRGNLGLEWIADAYRVAGNFIRAGEMFEDADYAAALARLPTEHCPQPSGMR